MRLVPLRNLWGRRVYVNMDNVTHIDPAHAEKAQIRFIGEEELWVQMTPKEIDTLAKTLNGDGP